jgi:hypothetical protein
MGAATAFPHWDLEDIEDDSRLDALKTIATNFTV